MRKKYDLTADTPSDLDAEDMYAEYDEYEETSSEQTVKAGGYRFFSVLLLLLAIGGLFLGMLSQFVSIFTPLVTVGEGVLAPTMLWVIIQTVMGFFGQGTAPDFGLPTDVTLSYASTLDSILTYLPLVIGGAVVLSLVLTIIALVSKKAAKGCFYVNAYAVVISYGATFVAMFAIRSLYGVSEWAKLVDVPTAIISGVALLILFGAAIIRKKGIALVNILLFLLTIGAAVSLFFPASAMLSDVTTFLSFEVKHEGIAFIRQIVILALLGLIFINLTVNVFRLGGKRGFAVATVRHALQLVAAIALIALYIFEGASPDWTVFMRISVIGVLATSFAAFLLALFTSIGVSRAKRKQKQLEAEEEEDAEEDEAFAYSAASAEPAPATEPTAAEPATAEPARAETPAPTAYAPPYGGYVAPGYVPTPGYMPVAPMYVAQPAPIVVTQPAPVAQPVVQQPVAQPAAQPTQPASAAPMSEFEESMTALAKGEAPATPAAKPVAAPSVQPTAVAKPAAQPVQTTMAELNKYTYDSFINSLTETEKNEFGDLFISKKFGTHTYLPPYVIGGDNSEFFSKVFIYLGKYRANISNNLLEKLYTYVNGRM